MYFFFSLKNAHNIHIHTEGKKLKKYKNKLHKRSSASLLANFLGRFFFSMCAASLSPSKVIRSLQISSFCHSSNMLATSPHLGVKSAQ